MEKNTNIDFSTTGNGTLSSSYFLSSTNNTYNGLLGTECSMDLNEILMEYSSILSLTKDSLEFATAKNPRSPLVIAGSDINYRSERTNISQIRHNDIFDNIRNITESFNLSGKSYCLKEMEDSIYSKELLSTESTNFMNDSAEQLNRIVNNIPNNYLDIENELCPTWNSIIDMSSDEEINSNFVSKIKFINIPDILVTKSAEDEFVNEKKIVYDISKSDFNHDNSNFFKRKGKKVYFSSPEKLANQNRSKQGIIKKENVNGSILSSGNYCEEKEELFKKRIRELPSFCIENITIPQWPPSVLEMEFDGDEEKSLHLFETSTPNNLEISSSNFSLNTENKGREEMNTYPGFNLGVSATKYFSRMKGLKYFNTPKR